MTIQTAPAAGQPWRSPYPPSTVIRGLHWEGEQHRYPASYGDTWSSTWADDDQVYVVGDDTTGVGKSVNSNLAIFRVRGTPPEHGIETVNPMAEYGPSNTVDGADTWKGAGLVSVDGVLYLGVGQHSAAMDYPDNIQQAYDGSLVKSVDHGVSWSQRPAVSKAMWPGPRFATPFFVQFGRDYQDAMDDYVYAVSNANAWNNANYLILGRVPRARIGNLDWRDWEFFAGLDAHEQPTWAATRLLAHGYKAKAIFKHRGFTSMGGIQWVPAVKRFLMFQWAYMDLDAGRSGPEAWYLHTVLHVYEAPMPWGPWRLVHSEPRWGDGNYGPSIPAKWFEDGGRRMWMIAAGYWGHPDYAFLVRKLALDLDG